MVKKRSLKIGLHQFYSFIMKIENMKNDGFAVLMSVYKNDDPNFFELALKSVTIDQSLKPNQVIIVQDGPVNCKIDNIISNITMACPNIDFTVIKKEKNCGLAAALNDGLNESQYELIARMDSDDISLSNRFEEQYNYMKNNSQVSAVGGAIAEFNEKPGDIKSERHVYEKHNDIVKMAKKRTPMNHVTVMYKRSSVLITGGYSENFGKLEDYKLWVDMISKDLVLANIDKIFVNVRVGNGFIERRSDKREIEDWDMLQAYLKSSKLIGNFTSLLNKIRIRVFIYMPGWMKRFIYRFLLRKTK